MLIGMAPGPEKVEISEDVVALHNALETGQCFRFRWGGVPGIALLAQDGQLRVYKGVCTHADCNVAWRSRTNDFFCACHEGRYDEYGKNIEGPPPRPLRRLFVELEGSPETKITKLTVWCSESVWKKKGKGY